MRGYYTQYGYMGYVPHLQRFILFVNEKEYLDYFQQKKYPIPKN